MPWSSAMNPLWFVQPTTNQLTSSTTRMPAL